MSDDVTYNFVIHANMIKLVLHVMPKAMEGELCSVRPKLLINDLAYAAANFAAKRIIPSFIEVGKEAVLVVVSCLLNMVQQTKVNQVGVNGDQSA